MRRFLRSLTCFASFGVLVLLFLSGCDRKLDESSFRRRAEAAYSEVHPGWTIYRREPGKTIFLRGDQFDTFEVGALFSEYQARDQKQSTSMFFDAWREAEEARARARRRTLEQAKDEVIPMIKSGPWIHAQDLGAIGPAKMQDKIRLWRRPIAADVFLVLGVPEERLGYRMASIEEVKNASGSEDEWVRRAIANVARTVATSSTGAEARGLSKQLLAYDLPNVDGVGGLVLDPEFRARMLEKFGRDHLGAAAPLRNVLIIFDPEDFVALKPVRARTHQLYDTQNHYGFRGLLRFDRDSVSLLEPADADGRPRPTSGSAAPAQ